MSFRFSPLQRLPYGIGILLVGWVMAPVAGRAQEIDGLTAAVALEKTLIEVIQSAEPSVVSIARIKRFAEDESADASRQESLLFPGSLDGTDNPEGVEYTPNEFGAGVVFAPLHDPSQRLILTTYHVVKGGVIAGRKPSGNNGDQLYVRTRHRQGAYAEILAADPRCDLAVLRLIPNAEPKLTDLKPTDLKPIRQAKTYEYRKGQIVITLGNPYALAKDGSASAGWGMLSNVARRPEPLVFSTFDNPEAGKNETIHHFGTLLQIDGQLNLGTSGGAVLNLRGELIGLVTAMAALDGYEKSVGYAIPINPGTLRAINALAQGFEVEYGLLGIQPQTVTFLLRDEPGALQSTAVKVNQVVLNSPAMDAGMRTGDVIYAVNGTPVYSQKDLMREVALLGPSESAGLKIYRPQGRERKPLSVTLAKWPVYNHEDIIATDYSPSQKTWRGLRPDFSTARKAYFNDDQYYRAVLVVHVEPESPADLAQIRVGDFITHVNNTPVATPVEFQNAVKPLTTGKVQLRLLNRVVTIGP